MFQLEFITNIFHFWPLVSEFVRFWEKIAYICFSLFGVIVCVSWTGNQTPEAERVLLSDHCSTSKPPRPDDHGLNYTLWGFDGTFRVEKTVIVELGESQPRSTNSCSHPACRIWIRPVLVRTYPYSKNMVKYLATCPTELSNICWTKQDMKAS